MTLRVRLPPSSPQMRSEPTPRPICQSSRYLFLRLIFANTHIKSAANGPPSAASLFGGSSANSDDVDVSPLPSVPMQDKGRVSELEYLARACQLLPCYLPSQHATALFEAEAEAKVVAQIKFLPCLT